MPTDTQPPCEGSGQRWAKRVDRTFLSQSSFPGLFDHFVIAWGIITTSLICRIKDFRGTWDPRRYCVLLFRPQAWWSWGTQTCWEHVWERGGTLAPGTSLRREVVLLAACLRGQPPESESLHWLCLHSMWTEALLVNRRFLKTQIGNCRIWSDWKCNGLLW